MTTLLDVDMLGVDYTLGSSVATALTDVSFRLATGERLAVIGESGSGKSTLALGLAGLLPRTARLRGTVTWPGLPSAPRNGADIGMVFQDFGGTLDPVMSVGRQIAEVVHANLGLDAPTSRQRALALLGRVLLPDPGAIFHAFPHQLSGGQKQRVGIAAAIAGEPVLLIADEPTSALDTIVQAEIMLLIDQIVREARMSLLLISHDIALAAQNSERLLVMRGGRIVELAPTRELVRSPRSGYAKSLIEAASVLDMKSARSAP